MEYTYIKNTGIRVSKICLGCMSFGKRGTMHDWTLNEEETDEMVRHALELGINFFDTANGYSAGTSEEYLGKALRKYARREDVVIASKVYFNEGRLKREAIFREIEGTLRRLETTYLDLYIIHRFDYETPMEETMEALHELVVKGKVRAIGASAMYASQFEKMNEIAERNGWTEFAAMEDHYNMIYREDEKDMIPYCLKNDIFLMPYSPLAAGHLTHTSWKTDSIRSKTDKVAMGKYDRMEEADLKIVKRTEEISIRHGCKMSEVALAWLWAKGISSPIIGATKKSYLDDAVHALSVHLVEDEIAYLDELYIPHPIVGAIDHNPPQGVILLDKKEEI